MATTTDLAKRVFWELGGDGGSSPGTDDENLITAVYKEVWERLYRLERISWPVATIPAWAVPEIKWIVAHELVSTFQVPMEDRVTIAANAKKADQNLLDLQNQHGHIDFTVDD